MATAKVLECQEVSISSTNAQSTALSAATEFWLLSTVDCFVTYGSNPVATASGNANLPVLANVYVPVEIPQLNGASVKIGAITASASGKLYIIPMG